MCASSGGEAVPHASFAGALAETLTRATPRSVGGRRRKIRLMMMMMIVVLNNLVKARPTKKPKTSPRIHQQTPWGSTTDLP
jgi:hypothetical protein